MTTFLYVVDAFAAAPFTGNPAAVCILDAPAEEGWMQSVAREMNLAETAFLSPIEGGYWLRWFTPALEVDLCGHATLASAFALWNQCRISESEDARFHTRSGWLTCRKRDDWIEMDFPALTIEPCPVPDTMGEALGFSPSRMFRSSMDFLVEVPDEEALRGLSVNLNTLAKLPVRGVIVTCKSQTAGYDFISRFFAPAVGVNEDPVTGSAHCALAPYWGPQLQKSQMKAYQASERGGVVHVELHGNRVLLRGQAVMMSRIEFFH